MPVNILVFLSFFFVAHRHHSAAAANTRRMQLSFNGDTSAEDWSSTRDECYTNRTKRKSKVRGEKRKEKAAW